MRSDRVAKRLKKKQKKKKISHDIINLTARGCVYRIMISYLNPKVSNPMISLLKPKSYSAIPSQQCNSDQDI